MGRHETPPCLWWLVFWKLLSAVALATPWSDIAEPAPGPARAIGSYAAGCVQGAFHCLLKAAGFQVMRP